MFIQRIFVWFFLAQFFITGQSYHCGGQFWSSKLQFLSAYVPCRIQNDHPGLVTLPSDNFQLARQPQDDRFESSELICLAILCLIIKLCIISDSSLSSWYEKSSNIP